MGKLVAGMLLALTAALSFIPTAGAAEIPPSAECVTTFKKLLREFEAAVPDDATDAELRKANRELAEGLESAGCVSDAEPLYRKVEVKPFSELCATTATEADDFWSPYSRRVRAIIGNWERRSKPLVRRIERLERRIIRLHRREGHSVRIRALIRRQNSLDRKRVRVTRAADKRLERVVGPQAWATYLLIVEFAARRCLRLDFMIAGNGKGPVYHLTEEHGELIIFSLIHTFFGDLRGVLEESGAGSYREGASASSSSELAPEADRQPLLGAS